LANAKNGKDCAQRAFDAKSRMMVRIDLILRIYHILGGFLRGEGWDMLRWEKDSLCLEIETFTNHQWPSPS
jgi:hypothetical protein